MKKILYTLSVLSITLFGACDKMLEVKSPYPSIDEAITSGEDFKKLIISCYDVLGNTMDGSTQNLEELLTENLAQPQNSEFYIEVYKRRTNFFNSTVGSVYNNYYIAIFRCNVTLENIDAVTDLSEAEKTQLEAEAKFIRAYCHYKLVNLFAQPYGYTSDNSHAGIVVREIPNQETKTRNTVKEVYDLIFSDLEFCEQNLPTENGIFASSYAAKGLLATIYFNIGDYNKAVSYSNDVINSNKYTFMADTIDRFQLNQTVETVFGIVSYIYSSGPNSGFIDKRSDGFGNYIAASGLPQLTASNEMYTMAISRPEDKRGAKFSIVNEGEPNESYVCSKFNTNIFSVPIIDLTKLKLIRAEALALLGQDLSTAISDINDIALRAYGSGTYHLQPNANSVEILNAVRYEKRIELFGEGERLYDLKRRGVSGEQIIIRDAPWDCPGMLLQFPSVENVDGWEFNEEGGC